MQSNSLLRPMAELTVTGLCIRWAPVNDAESFSIGGPGIYAALGARLVNAVPTLGLRLGIDVSHRELVFITRLGSLSSEIERVEQANLLWQGPILLDQTRVGMAVGEPTSMSPAQLPGSDGWLTVANLDPSAILSAVGLWTGPVAVDCYEPWIRFRPKSSIALASRADVLFLTERELAAFPGNAQRFILEAKDRFVVLKKGSRGVSLYHNGHERQLPAPTPLVIRSDLGAGDLLLGLLSGHLAGASGPNDALTIDNLEEAYFTVRPWLSELLSASHPIEFLARHEYLA